MYRLWGIFTAYLVVCSLLAGISEAQENVNARDAVLRVDMRFLGNNILPFNLQNQNAVISGISNLLQDGITVSDISLTVLKTYDSITAYGNRRLLQSAFPAVDVALNITTSASKAQNESQTLIAGSNETYSLASNIGAQGLQTQQIVVQSIDTVSTTSPPPDNSSPPSPSPPSPSPPPPQTPAASPQPPTASSPTGGTILALTPPPSPSDQTPTPEGSAAGTTSSAGSSQSSSGISGGAIAGIAIGAAALLGLIAGLFLWRRRRNSKKIAEQNNVIDYYSGVGKPGQAHTGPIVADSSSAPSAAAQSDLPKFSPLPERANVNFGNPDEKVEYTENGEKAEVPRGTASPKFMDVKI